MHQKFSQSSTVLRVLALSLACLFSSVAALAQEKAANIEPSVQPQSSGTVETPRTGETNLPATDAARRKATSEPSANTSKPATKSNNSAALGAISSAGNASNAYKTALSELQALHEREVQKLEQQNNQLKALYHDGLIARVEMEKSDRVLADARAKVEETRNQIAEANKPAPIISAAAGNSVLSDAAWSTGDNRVDTLVRFYGNKYGVDPYLIFCLMHQESRFTLNATSPKGAQGLMQLMPGTAARYGVTNPYDVEQSIMGGTRYLKDLLKMFNGRIDLALAGYNAGENAVIKYGYVVPPYQETRNYVRLISARYGKRQPPTISEPAL